MANRQIYTDYFPIIQTNLAFNSNDKNNEKGLYTRFASENNMFMTLIHINLSFPFYFRWKSSQVIPNILETSCIEEIYNIPEPSYIFSLSLS